MAEQSPASDLKRTPLHDAHVALGARMVPFAGYEMPVQYPTGIMAEHNHTREKAGLFDVSHMGQAILAGPGFTTTAAALEALVPADIASLEPGQQRYSQLLNDDECIIDFRDLKEATGIGVEDVAKRLVDYGFHAPTMSWPVPETLMIEPTESEGQDEIDRFCDAMISIREEIAEVEQGKADEKDNVLRNAPHTHHALLANWTRSYSRERAFFPLKGSTVDKYWPPVARVDNVYGDRNLVCTCPAPEAYADAAE